MSNIYALEPHTNAKVILHTTAGDVEIEMWGKEAPKATRNFIQLCMEGYYDNTIFHRIVPNFIIQGGDPTGTGQGGESIYEEGEFPNEYHSRLRFVRRGLVGMANSGEGDNGSQFFITLDRADELTKKHTLFGRVVGDTIFNVLKMGEMEIDENERPLYPPRIKSTEIILNPFDDIVPRITEREKKVARALELQKAQQQQGKKKKKEKKQLNLLSFGEEAEEMEPEINRQKTKMKSSYDFLPDAPKSEEPSAPIVSPQQPKSLSPESPEESKVNHVDVDEPVKQSAPVREKTPEKERPNEKVTREQSEIDRLRSDIRKMEQERRDEKEGKVPEKKQKKKSLVELEREKFTRRGAATTGGAKTRKKMQDDAFSQLLAFQKKLTSAVPDPDIEMQEKKEEPPCELHSIPGCESCYDRSKDPAEEESDKGWMTHKLVFEKDYKGKDLMQRAENVDDYVVIDPRSRQAQAEQEERERRKEKKSRVGEAFRKRDREHDYDDDRGRKYRRDDYSRSSRRRSRDDYDRR